MAEQSSQPWPRFLRASPEIAPAVRQAGPHEPWPRWGWFPREQRTWTLAPGPSLVGHLRPAPLPAAPPAAESDALGSSPGVAAAGAGAAAGAADEPIVARPMVPRFVQGAREGQAPAERFSTTALVPVRRELVLADVTRAARRVAPAAAMAGVVVVAALALFRRR